MGDLAGLVEKLSRASLNKSIDPYSRIEWPAKIDPNAWYMSPELLSLYGMPEYDSLSEAARRRLAFLEAVNFFSLNVHGERALISEAARRLYAPGFEEVTPYLLHFIAEENRHLVYFGSFCTRYHGGVYPEKKFAVARDQAPGEEDFLLFAKILIFEEVVNVYNFRMSRDKRLAPIARTINRFHHLEEARHLAFGRAFVCELFERYAHSWSRQTLADVQRYLGEYLASIWLDYYNADVYRELGVPEPLALRRSAWEHPSRRAHCTEVSAHVVDFLVERGMLAAAPVL